MSVGIDGATVTQLAQRHEVTRQQIYAWRHELMKKGLWSCDARALISPLDMPIVARVPVAQPPVVEASPPVAVELRLRSGRSLHFESSINPAALSVLSHLVHIDHLGLFRFLSAAAAFISRTSFCFSSVLGSPSARSPIAPRIAPTINSV